MYLSEIFSQLAYGELSQLSLGGGGMGQINEANYPAVLSHVNLGLTTLHKRFNLKEGRVTIELQPERFTYPLTSAFAEANRRSREPDRHIMDSQEDPFLNDIMKIERVYTDTGAELSLNDESDPYSCFTPSMSSLRVPSAVVLKSQDIPVEYLTSNLVVVYRANHPIIEMGTTIFNPATVEVSLPYTHLEPLLLFIASRCHNPSGSVDRMHLGNNYSAKYEQACQQLEQTNIRVDVGRQSDRLHKNGWV